MAESNIELAQLLQAIRDAGFGDEATASDAKTLGELAGAWRCSNGSANRILRRANAAGLLRSTRSKRMRIDGVLTPVPVYWFEMAQAKGKKK